VCGVPGPKARHVSPSKGLRNTDWSHRGDLGRRASARRLDRPAAGFERPPPPVGRKPGGLPAPTARRRLPSRVHSATIHDRPDCQRFAAPSTRPAGLTRPVQSWSTRPFLVFATRVVHGQRES
jgi:hypothetical protein